MEIPWENDKLIWVVMPPQRFIVADAKDPRDEFFVCEIRDWEGDKPPKTFCGARKPTERLICPLWKGHDCPHIPCRDDLLRHYGGFTVVGLKIPA